MKNTQDPQTGLNGFFVRNVDENKAESSPSRAKERMFINRSESECHSDWPQTYGKWKEMKTWQGNVLWNGMKKAEKQKWNTVTCDYGIYPPPHLTYAKGVACFPVGYESVKPLPFQRISETLFGRSRTPDDILKKAPGMYFGNLLNRYMSD